MHSAWKTIKKGEYLYAKIPNHPNATKNGYVLEHRAVMERKLGRYLLPNELVHHKDENKHNNDEDNLQIMTIQEHNKHHNSTGRNIISLVCPVCASVFQREKRQIKKNTIPCCSRSCNGKRSKQIQMVANIKDKLNG